MEDKENKVDIDALVKDYLITVIQYIFVIVISC